MNPKMKELVHSLAKCIHMCNECLNACLDEKDVTMMKECIRLDKICSDFCALTLKFVGKSGRYNKELLSLCKTICRACADECRKHPVDHCQRCADICEGAEKACSDFLDDTYDGVC